MSLDSTSEATFSPSSDSAPLSVADAVSLLTSEPEDVAEIEAPQDQASEDQTDAEDDAPVSDEPASEEASEDDDGDTGEPQAAAIAPPEFWSAEEKALFAQAPPDVQMLVAAKTAEAEKRVYAAKEDAAQFRKEASRVAEQAEILDQFLAQAEPIFRDRWEGVDFVAWAATDPQAAFQAKLEYDAEQKTLSEAKAARQIAQSQEHRQFLADEFAKLKEASHPLADPQKGKESRQALLTYMTSQGIPEEAFSWASASELTIAHKAMLYDQLQAERARKPVNPQNPAQSGAAATRPTAPPPPRKIVAQRKKAEIVQRAMKTGRSNDVHAAFLALEE